MAFLMAQSLSLHLVFMFISLTIASGQNTSAITKTFTLVNRCKETIWPGILTKVGNNHGPYGYGLALEPGRTAFYDAPAGWSGRIWARTGCNLDDNGTLGTCQTGSCGPSLNCSGPSSPPNTIAEFTLGELDFYDVSLVDGFNLPIVINPLKGQGNCSIAGCDGDLRRNCPLELTRKSSDGKTIACQSACSVFNTDEYCCRGTYADPLACLPTNYSKIFKQVCPAASSYALDDRTSVLTCSASDYIVAFCASRNQTVCSYHGNRLVCNTSSSAAREHPRALWIWNILRLLALPLALMSRVKL